MINLMGRSSTRPVKCHTESLARLRMVRPHQHGDKTRSPRIRRRPGQRPQRLTECAALKAPHLGRASPMTA